MSAVPGLKEQFEAILDQQKEKYLSKKVLGLCQNAQECGLSTQPKKLSLDDNLSLCTIRDLKRQHMHQDGPTTNEDQEIEFLRNEVHTLQSRVAELSGALGQKADELATLRRKVDEEREALGGVSSKATHRIVELSRKNRELMAELAVESNRVKQMRKELEVASKSSATEADGKTEKASSQAPDAQLHEDKSTVARLQDELTQAKQRGLEYRNQCQQLKHDLRLAHKALVMETGEEVNLSTLLSNGGGGWRGRAQQITALQNRVAELKQQLQLQGTGGTHKERSDARADDDGDRVEERQKAAIRKMQEERKKSLDELRSELESLRDEHNKCQQQNAALKARNKIIAADLKAAKEQVANLLQKTAQDGALIKSKPPDQDYEPAKPSRAANEENKLLKAELKACRGELERLKEQPGHSQASSRCSSKLNHRPATPHSTALPPIHSALHHKKVPDKGVLSTRLTISAGHKPLGVNDVNISKLQTLLQVAEVERDRLFELNGVLQARLDSSIDSQARQEAEMRMLQQHTADLEKHVVAKPCTTCKQPSKMSRGSNSTDCNSNMNLEDLQSQLTIQVDENNVLKETLELTRHQKMEDVKQLQSMLQGVRQMFVESINAMLENPSAKYMD